MVRAEALQGPAVSVDAEDREEMKTQGPCGLGLARGCRFLLSTPVELQSQRLVSLQIALVKP